MPSDKSTARETDDLETAERKSKTIDERVPEPEDTDAIPEMELPGAITRGGPILPEMGSDSPGPGEVVLEQEAKAQRTPPSR
jgi:hypothetical protein